MSTNLLAQASGSPLIVTMTRGDGSNVTYQENTSGSYVSYSPRNLDTLAQDTVDNLWKETTQDGITTAYPLNTTGQITSVSYIQDAIGNRHTYSYSSGRLANIEDAVGRLITFAYNSSNVLSTIEDWAGHLTTFAYNTTLISGSPVLTTVTGPSGCEVVYAYNSSGQLTEITNPNGYATNYNYDSNGYITSRIVAGTYVSTYTYGAGFTTVAEPATAIVTNTLDSNYNIAGAVSAKSGVTTYTRNSKGQEISSHDHLRQQRLRVDQHGFAWEHDNGSAGRVRQPNHGDLRRRSDGSQYLRLRGQLVRHDGAKETPAGASRRSWQPNNLQLQQIRPNDLANERARLCDNLFVRKFRQ
jgi:YD repeat-containing protein